MKIIRKNMKLRPSVEAPSGVTLGRFCPQFRSPHGGPRGGPRGPRCCLRFCSPRGEPMVNDVVHRVVHEIIDVVFLSKNLFH